MLEFSDELLFCLRKLKYINDATRSDLLLDPYMWSAPISIDCIILVRTNWRRLQSLVFNPHFLAKVVQPWLNDAIRYKKRSPMHITLGNNGNEGVMGH